MLRKISEMYNKSKFSRNTAPKVLSIIFALVFWIFVMDKVNPEMTRLIENVHIELLGVEELKTKGYIILGERDFVVDLKIRGRRSEVINVSKNDIQISADLGELSKGIQSVPLEKNIVAQDVSIIEISKSFVKVIVDENVRRPIDVQIIKQGNIPSGFIEEGMYLSLQQVFVKGPESYVDTISSIRGIINVNNATTEILEEVAVSAVDSNGELVTEVELETNYITVRIPISKLGAINIHPITTGLVKDGYQMTSIESFPPTVQLKGERDVINAIKFIETLPINISNMDSSFEVKSTLDLPEGVTLNENITEVDVSITIEKISTKEFTFELTDIPFINLDDNLRTNKNELDGVILLRISAVESVLDNVTKSDLALYINAEKFEPGTSNVTIELNKINDFYEVEIIPSYIELEIYNIEDVPSDTNNN